MLGHGHAARADVAVDINLSLGHGVGHAVGGIAVNDNLSAGIEPAHVVGSRTEHLDERIGKPHGTETLSRRSRHIHLDWRFSGPPETTADTMLAVSRYLNMTIALGYSLLNPLFESSRFNTDSVYLAGYY